MCGCVDVFLKKRFGGCVWYDIIWIYLQEPVSNRHQIRPRNAVGTYPPLTNRRRSWVRSGT